MDFVTIEGIEIVTAGMDWPAQPVSITVTVEHIADAIRAANEDPLIHSPRHKLGHTSEINGEFPNFSPFAALGDAEPAFGRFANLRSTNGGAVLLADLVECPAWLAEAMPSAFPSRSMECCWDVETLGGKRYSMVITAVSSLGTALPAVRDLEDLERVLTDGLDLAASTAADSQGGTVPSPTSASVSTSVVRTRFNYEWTADPENGADVDTYWWWARDVRVDPDEIIADDDEGNLWSVPYSTDGADTVTFGTPVRVLETYVAAPPAAAGATGRVVASFSRPRKQPRTTNAATAANDHQEAPTMDVDTTLLRRRLGLAEDATEEQINAALAADPEVTEPAVEGEAEEVAALEAEAPEPVAASTDGRTVTVDRAQWEETQRQAADGAAARAEQVSASRDALVDAAITDGRIAPASRAAWRDALDARPEEEAATLAALTPGRIPVKEIGKSPSTDASAADDLLEATRARLGIKKEA